MSTISSRLTSRLSVTISIPTVSYRKDNRARRPTPQGYDFADYEWEVEAKGWFSEATLIVAGKRYRLNFYDATRLSQEIEDDLERDGLFFEPNLVIVKFVTRSHMERAAEWLAQSVLVKDLVAE